MNETITMQLLVNSGEARSRAMEAIACAKRGEIGGAMEKLKEADAFLTKAHEIQAQIIEEEASGGVSEITVLLIHAQDHLMNAITVKALAGEFVDLYEKFYAAKG